MGPYSLAIAIATAIDGRFIWAFCFTRLVVGHLPSLVALVIFSLAIFYHFIFFSLSILAR